MKTIINQNEITFQFRTYDLIVPNNVNIEYKFNSLISETIGSSLSLMIKSMSKKVVPKYWFGNIVYRSSVIYRLILKFLLPGTTGVPSSIIESAPTTVYGEKNINSFLLELKKFNYFGIDQQIVGFNEILKQKSLNALIPGTKKYNNDKLKLVLMVFLIFGVPIAFSPLTSENTSSADYLFSGLILLVLLIFCLTFYKVTTKQKIKK